MASTPRCEKAPGCPARHGRLSSNEDRLDIDELLNAVGGEFATIATLFDPAKRQARIGFHEGVDEITASLQFVSGNVLTFGHILCEDGCVPPSTPGVFARAVQLATSTMLCEPRDGKPVFLGRLSVLFLADRSGHVAIITPCRYPLCNVSSGTSVGVKGVRWR